MSSANKLYMNESVPVSGYWLRPFHARIRLRRDKNILSIPFQLCDEMRGLHINRQG